MKLLKNEKGVSLVEVIAGIPLAIILFGVLAMTMLHFVQVYQETKLYTQLQEDLYNAIEVIRYGYSDEYYNMGEGLIGLMTARDVEISPNRRIMTVYPMLVEQNPNFKCVYTINDKEQMTLSEIQPKLEGEAVLLAKKLEGLLISRFADNDKEEI